MSALVARATFVRAELVKVPAFVRRDFLVAWSYRMSFFSDIVNLVGQALLFYFVGLMVDPSTLPTYGGTEVTYLEFTVVGIALGVFMHFALSRVATAVRGEQLMGTLESVLMTPTSTATVQFGSVAFDLIYIPIRTALFFIVIAVTFGLNLDASGLLPAMVLLLTFIPFVWGLGIASAAAILTFRRGAGVVGLGAMALAMVSGLYFPVDLLPEWLVSIVQWNPIAIAIDGMRQALLGGSGWSEVGPDLLLLLPMSAAALALGLFAFKLALRRERGTGTLGVY
jgi:ABC-2 type transport system permease protein